MKKIFMMCLLGLNFVSCDVDIMADESNSTKPRSPQSKPRDLTQPLSGKINGKLWDAVSGKVEQGYEEGTFRVTVYNQQSEDVCSILFSGEPMLLFGMQDKTGMDYLSLSHNVTMAYQVDGGSMNVIAQEGYTDVLAIDDTTVEIELKAFSDADHSVGGRISLKRCDN